MLKNLQAITFFNLALLFAGGLPPKAPGKLIDLGGHKLHLYCTGQKGPTVVIEAGLGDISTDWSLVQARVAPTARVCAYDRAGYAWSDAGPKPRTFDQINLELHDALAKAGEPGPYILVGHSFGGPVVRNFALRYPSAVAGIVFVDAAHEGLRVPIGGGKTIRLGEGAQRRQIPEPRHTLSASDAVTIRATDLPPEVGNLDPAFDVLRPEAQAAHGWAQQQPAIYDAQASETQWSEEYFAKWLANPQDGTLGAIPIVVLSPANQDAERAEGQRSLLRLSSNSKQTLVPKAGHNMHLENPEALANAIGELVKVVR